MKYYTITEVAEELGVERQRILRLVKSGKIQAEKGENSTSPYQISEDELKKFRSMEKIEIESEKKSPKKQEQEVVCEIIDHGKDIKHYEDFIQIQKILVETMRALATTQEQIAATLRELVKKV